MKTKNICGSCTACCHTLGVGSIQKPPNSNCSFCVVAHGCTIYENRPLECQDFECSWLIGKGGGIDHRPDKTGVVPFHVAIPDVGFVLVFSESRIGALNSEFIFKWTRNNQFRANFTIHHPIQGNSRLYLPKGAKVATEDERKFLEDLWKRKIDFINFESSLQGLVL